MNLRGNFMKHISFINLTANEIYNHLNSSPKGLSTKEASNRIKQYGYNELPIKKKTNLLKQFIEQFKDFMIIILIIAALVSFIASFIEGNTDFMDPIIILGIMINDILLLYLQIIILIQTSLHIHILLTLIFGIV